MQREKTQPSTKREAGAERQAFERTCVSCRKHATRGDLVRLVADADGRLAVDVRSRASGRGAWVHPSRTCLELAIKRHAAERSLKIPVQELSVDALLLAVRDALQRQVLSLLGVAHARRSLVVGAAEVEAALKRGKLVLLVSARDAGEQARSLVSEAEGLSPDQRKDSFPAAVSGRVWGTKVLLGSVLGRSEVAVVAVTDESIAQALSATLDRSAGLEG